MKKILCFLFLLNMIRAHAQPKWQYLPNIGLDTTKKIRFEDVYFTNYTTGFAINLDAKIYKTTDGGTNWKVVAAGPKPSGTRSIEFLNDGQTGIAGGFAGMVVRSDDYGETWQIITSKMKSTSCRCDRMQRTHILWPTELSTGREGGETLWAVVTKLVVGMNKNCMKWLPIRPYEY